MTALPYGTRPVPRSKGLRLLPGGSGDVSGRFTRNGGSPEIRVDLLSADRDFADAIPTDEQAMAHRALQLPRVELESGPWPGPPERREGASPGGLLVLDGLISQSTTLHGRTSVELHGPGDFIGAGDAFAPTEGDVTWCVHQQSTLAYLDDRFALAATRWPRLWHVVLQRAAVRANRLSAQLAALHLSRIDDRLEAVLWQLADRWGRVTPDGIVLPLTLTHQMLGHLTAAKRPTVSVALGALAERGSVVRRPDGSWLLRSEA